MNQIGSKKERVNEKELSKYLIANHFQILFHESFMH